MHTHTLTHTNWLDKIKTNWVERSSRNSKQKKNLPTNGGKVGTFAIFSHWALMAKTCQNCQTWFLDFPWIFVFFFGYIFVQAPFRQILNQHWTVVIQERNASNWRIFKLTNIFFTKRNSNCKKTLKNKLFSYFLANPIAVLNYICELHYFILSLSGNSKPRKRELVYHKCKLNTILQYQNNFHPSVGFWSVSYSYWLYFCIWSYFL